MNRKDNIQRLKELAEELKAAPKKAAPKKTEEAPRSPKKMKKKSQIKED